MSRPVASCCAGCSGRWKSITACGFPTAAIMAAVNLSHRYIPARQLPDKAVSLLDTAAARVAISQSATPALIEDARVAIAAREAERAALVSDSDLGIDDADRMTSLDADIAALKEKLVGLESEWAMEQALVNDIRSIRQILAEPQQGDARRPQSALNCAASSTRWRASRRKAHDLCPCRRAIRGVCGVGLDRHPRWPHGARRNRDRSEASGDPQSPRRRPVARAGDDRPRGSRPAGQARQSIKADRRIHARRPLRCRQD